MSARKNKASAQRLAVIRPLTFISKVVNHAQPDEVGFDDVERFEIYEGTQLVGLFAAAPDDVERVVAALHAHLGRPKAEPPKVAKPKRPDKSTARKKPAPLKEGQAAMGRMRLVPGDAIDLALSQQRDAVVHLLEEIDTVRQGLRIDTADATEWLAQICTALNGIAFAVESPSKAGQRELKKADRVLDGEPLGELP
jgi:hypothetical protein